MYVNWCEEVYEEYIDIMYAFVSVWGSKKIPVLQ